MHFKRLQLEVRKIIDLFMRKPEIAFVAIAVPFGTLSALLVPQLSVTDENAHLLRSYQISRGEFICKKITTYPENIASKAKQGSASVRDYDANFSDNISKSPNKKYTCGPAASYTPLAYIPQAIGVALAGLLNPSTGILVLAARLANLVVYISAMYWVIKKVKFGKYAFLIVALIPQMIHLAASMSGDAMNAAVMMAIVAVTINIFTQQSALSKMQIITLTGLIAAAALLKSSIVLMFLPFILLPARKFRIDKYSKNIPDTAMKIMFVLLGGALFAILHLAWQSASFGSTVKAVAVANPIAENPSLFFNLIFNTYLSDYGDLVLRGTIGEFSSFLYHFPTSLILLQIILILLAFIYVPKSTKIPKRMLWLTLGCTTAFIGSILAITYGLYVDWGLRRGITLYADGVQGRYFTPLIVLLAPLFMVLSRHLYIRVKSERMFLVLILGTQIAILSYYIFMTFRITDIL